MRTVFLGLKKIFTFRGRTTRAEFWPYLAMVIVAYFIMSFAAAIYVFVSAATMEMETRAASGGELSPKQFNQITLYLVALIFKATTLPGIATILLLAAIVVRRLHDTGKSGILLFSFLIVIAGHLSLLYYGGPTIVVDATLKLVTQILLWAINLYEIVVFFMLIIACVRESEAQDNCYGPNPYPQNFETLKQSIASIAPPKRQFGKAHRSQSA